MLALRRSELCALAAVAGVVVLSTSACAGPIAEGEPEIDCGDARVCDSDRVCGGGFCERENADAPLGCCVALKAECTSDGDCAPGQACVDFNFDERLPAFVCSSGPGELCSPLDDGTCPNAGELCLVHAGDDVCTTNIPAPDRCTLATSGAVVASGTTLTLRALAFTADGAPAPHATAFTFEVSDGSVGDAGAFIGSCAGPTECIVHVVAHVSSTSGDVSCDGVVRVEPFDDAATRVVVVDDRGAPLADMPVDLRTAGVFVSSTTDADGVVVFSGRGDLITVRPSDRDWFSLFTSSGVSVVTLRAPQSNAGFTGALDTSRVHTSGDVRFAIASFAQRSLVDFNLGEAFSAARADNINISGIGSTTAILPSALSFSFADQPITDPLIAVDAQGTRDAVAMAVELSLADCGPIFTGEITTETLLRKLAPFIDRGADHALLFGASTSSSLNTVTIAPSTLAAETVTIHAEALPAATTDLIAAAFVRKPDSGFLLLGFNEVFDDNHDGSVADFPLDFAPPHDGLEGLPVTIAVAAVDADVLTADQPYLGPASVRFVTFANAAALAEGVDATLLAPPTSTFDGDNFSSGGDVARVDLVGPAGGWHVYGASSFTVDALTGDVTALDRATSARATTFSTSRAPFLSSAPLDDVVTALASASAN